ncbi:MAG: LysM peptidoglycan-binding domain-containing protein [Saprospiraceae bacterium]|nr:LysM peptidoglycan-binding domain-containing protein [Saprospiraceae bacterium]
MSLQSKYQSVLNLGEEIGVVEGGVSEEGAQLKVWGKVDCEYKKNQLWDQIKKVGGENPADIVADIQVLQNDYYAKHEVSSGESLSLIAKHYYKDMMAYTKIFEANRDILDDPDKIKPGQVLTIPFP